MAKSLKSATDSTSEDSASILLGLYRVALGLKQEELYKYFLDYAVKLTNSKIGFFHLVESNQKTIILTCWNKEALNNCMTPDETHYPIEKAGNWVDCVRFKRPIIYNDFLTSPNQKGLPKGHVPITRMLSLPIFEANEIFAIYGVGNKKTPYDKNDVHKLELVATELKQILRQRKIEQQLRFQSNILGLVAESVIATDNEGKIIYWNKASEKLYGWTAEEAVGKITSDLLFPQKGKEQINEVLKEVYQSKTWTGSVLVKHKTGSNFWVLLNITPFTDDNGQINGIIGTSSDITESKNAQEALRESEERFSKAFLANPSAMAISLPNGQIVDVNASFEKLMGYKREEVIGQLGRNLSLYASSFEREKLVKQLKEKSRISDYEIKFRHKSGKLITTLFSLEPITLKGQLHLLGTAVDITTRKKAEEALKKSEEKFSKAFNASPAAISISRLSDGLLVDINDAYSDVFGYSHQEAVGHTSTELGIFTDSKGRSELLNLLKTNGIANLEVQFKRKNGDTFDAILSVDRIEIANVPHIITYVLDVTERKKAEEKLKLYTERLEQTQKKLKEYADQMEKLAEQRANQLKQQERLAAIGATAGMVGHDIRNPLQAMMSDIYLLKDELSSMPGCKTKEGVAESLDGIEKNISYINKIVADLQDYARPVRSELTEFNLYELLTAVFQHINLPDDVDCRINVGIALEMKSDATLLRRILTNLIINAIQAMPSGGRLVISGYPKDDKMLITIEDNGVGIPEDFKPKLFQPMMTNKSKGQGLGLAVVKRLVEALNGHITLESKEGKGTKFIVELPL